MARFNTLTVSDIKRETEDCVSIGFDVPEDLRDAYDFRQGQYLTLKTTIDGEEVRRSYSICAGVPEGRLRVAVKTVPGGVFSTYANSRLHPGDVLEVMPPAGRFTTPIEPEKAKSYVLFAAGSGITPVMSIVKTVLALEPDSDVTLFYGNRRGGSIIFREDLEDLKNTYMDRLRVFHVLSRDVQQTDLLRGRLDREKVDALLDAFVDLETTDHVFVCGPEGMTEAVRDALKDRAFPSGHVHFELFGAPGQAKAAAKPASEPTGEQTTVRITMDGLNTEFAMDRAETVLDAGRTAGLDLPFACKGGVCATCRCKVVDGDVAMDVNYGLEEAEVKAGYILSCQARPKTKSLTVDFDA
ncbi:Phenylacetate-CoA oxygenase/reductase, PaaK subunit [Caenispirillum salinarum AK4]|uniref:Phenylacetate-CoA oxygenase/reductase, PaaK subunit n=1 Tax=Caenispirillum salinarum AK4 TaxID=1238182 RepID=K9H110_9PROT|nr:1,2-phenylacetyl-CoA epoxidase subunit PaaE [Caenispirillum salinarum]EKV30709.1 Phenylacetate-CoA oxygenase/reductase, PaaK subunit [Caenispirillum salinarum AK4]